MATPPPRPVHVFREVLATTRHVEAFLALVLDRLGDRAVVERFGEKGSRVFLRAGRAGHVVPWHVVQYSVARRPPGELPSDGVEFIEPDPITGIVEFSMELFKPVAAALSIHDGPDSLTVNYRWNGDFKDCVESAPLKAFANLLPALAQTTDNRLELLAAYVADMDVGRHGMARVVLPVPAQVGPGGVWSEALRGIREAMATPQAPGGSYWVAADGYTAEAMAFGTSRQEALDAWREEVDRVRPVPPDPPDLSPFDLPEEERARIEAERAALPPFDPSPELVPGAVLRVAALPEEPPPRGTWTRWLGRHGRTIFAVRLTREHDYTLVADALLERFDLATIEAELDRLDDANPLTSIAQSVGFDPTRPQLSIAIRKYQCVDERKGQPIALRYGGHSLCPAFDVRTFDGSALETKLIRVCRIE